MKPLFVTCVFALLISTGLNGQQGVTTTRHSLMMKSRFSQYKEAFNYGLVFQGVDPLTAGYSLEKEWERSMLIFSTELAFGPSFNKGTGVHWYFKPVDLYLAWKQGSGNTSLFWLGGYISGDYKWQQYSEIQGGKMFWFASFELGPKITSQRSLGGLTFRASASASFAGWNSRPESSTETYFYSFQPVDFLKNPHSNLTFGSLGLFRHFRLDLEIFRKGSHRVSLGYGFEYYAYTVSPEVRFLAHSLGLKILLGNIK